MTPNNFARLEDPDYGKHTLSSLKRIAEALDVALVVRLVPFSQYIDWLSGTPHLDEGLRPEALAVPSFADEEESGVIHFAPQQQGFTARATQTIFSTSYLMEPMLNQIPASFTQQMSQVIEPSVTLRRSA